MKISFFSTMIVAAELGRAEAFAAVDGTVACDGDTPEVCRGHLYFETPVAAWPDSTDDNPEIVYQGKYLWQYSFVRGLPDGFFDEDYSGYNVDYGIYSYGPSVEIWMDVDEVDCTVTVGNETCNTCELCKMGDWVGEAQNSTFSADCTNLRAQNYTDSPVGAGRLMECEPTLPFFYPLEIPSDLHDLPSPTFSPSSEDTMITEDATMPPQRNLRSGAK